MTKQTASTFPSTSSNFQKEKDYSIYNTKAVIKNKFRIFTGEEALAPRLVCPFPEKHRCVSVNYITNRFMIKLIY